jgi:hypothetical protein
LAPESDFTGITTKSCYLIVHPLDLDGGMFVSP